MKITKVTEEYIQFNNGKKITFDHEQDCCEYNYADFLQIDDLALDQEFKEPLDFEIVEGFGFRFGNLPFKMYGVPCYTEQNGYYTKDIDIYYDGNKVLHTICEYSD